MMLVLAGCGGGGGNLVQQPIRVSLPVSTITVAIGARPLSVPIQIVSTSETAVVTVGGLPAGVLVSYAASDTNPSGSLTFSAGTTAMPGTTMPFVTVNSAGQTTSTSFTLIVAKP
jgi:hypothetical protein